MWQVRKTNELKPGFGALEEVDDDARVADTSPMQGDKEVAAENLDLKAAYRSHQPFGSGKDVQRSDRS